MENNVNEEVKFESTEAEERRRRQERMLIEYRDLVVKLAILEHFFGNIEFDNLLFLTGKRKLHINILEFLQL